MKFIKLVKSAKSEGNQIKFDCTAGSLKLEILNDTESMYDNNPRRNRLYIGCWSGGDHSNCDYYKEGPEDFNATVADAKAILPELEQICSEFDNKVIALMEKYGYKHK